MLQEESYRKIKAINNSLLKHINPTQNGSAQKYFQELTDPSGAGTKSTNLGNLLHKYVEDPDNFTTVTVELPSDTIQEILNDFMNSMEDEKELLEFLPRVEAWEDWLARGTFKDRKQVLAEVLETKDWYKKRSIDSRMNTVFKEGIHYLNFLIESSGKTLLSADDVNQLENMKTSILRNKSIKHILETEQWQTETIEVKKELVLTAEYTTANGNTFKLKGIIDHIRFDHEDKTFVITDTKTTGFPIRNYPREFVKYHTYRQVAFYKHLVEANFPGYTCKGVHIAAVMSKSPFLSDLFVVKERWLYYGKLEMNALLDRVAYHTEHSNWVDDMEWIMDPRHFTLLDVPKDFELGL